MPDPKMDNAASPTSSPGSPTAWQPAEASFRQLAEHIQEVLWMIDQRTQELIYISPVYEQIWGRTCQSLYEQPRSFLDAVHPEDRERVVAALERQRHGEETAIEYRIVRPDGSVRWIWDRGFPIKDPSGQVYRTTGIAQDITRRKRAEEAQRFLAEASTLLFSSLDYETTLRNVAQLVVPSMADWCAIDLCAEDGSLQRLAVAHVDPAKVAWAYELQRRYPPDPNAPHGIYQVIRSGKAEFYPEIPEHLLAASARDAEHLRLLREIGFTAAICVPLTARGRVLGALTFVTTASRRHYDADDLATAEALARHAALAVDNALLYRAAQHEIAERRRAEEALRESEASFRLLFANHPHPLWVYDLQTLRFLEVNEAAVARYGYTREEFLQLRIIDIRPPEDVARLLEEVAKARPDLQFSGQWRHRCKDGQIIDVQIVSHTLEFAGRPAVLVVAEDITERKRAEQRLAAQHAVSRVLADATSLEEAAPRILQAIGEHLGWALGALWIVDDAAGVLRCRTTWHTPAINTPLFEAANEAPFLPGSGLPGSVWASGEPAWVADVTSDRRFVRIEAATAASLHTACAFPIQSSGRTLGVIEFFGSAIQSPDDDLLQLVGTLGNQIGQFIERKRAEEALRESEERFRLLVEGVQDYAIYMLDPAGQIVSWNAGVERLTGYRADEILGRHFSCLHPPEEIERGTPNRELQMAAATGRFEVEGWRVRKDGTRFWANCILSALYDEASRLCGFAKVIRDITERKRMEEMRRRSAELEERHRRAQEANRLKSEFLANMSHELRTPLNSIIGFAELMHDGLVGPIADHHKEYLGDILTSARHLLQLINDILDLSKIEAGKMEFRPEPVDLAKLVGEVRDILRTIASKKQIRVTIAVDPSIGPIMIDPARLKQVLYNYLSNALKFTPEGGQVMVCAKPAGPDAFRIEVEDTGIGIRPEDMERLFHEFEQLDAGSAKKHQGTGLGLALTRRIVEAQGGTVEARSTPGQGSTFSATLPRSPRSAQARPTPESLPTASVQGDAPVVLVIEDDPVDRAWLARTLREAGYQVETAASGTEALAKCHARAFDAITLDLLLPDMGGWDVLRAIRHSELNRHVPTIVVTVVAEKDAGMGFSIQDFLVKPVQVTELLAALERAGVPPGRTSIVLVVDDDLQLLKLMEATLSQLGLKPICCPDGEHGLQAAAQERPAVVVLDLLMPEVDGFEFLRRFRSTSMGRRTPVIIWTNKDLTAEERAQIQASAEAVVLKSQGGTSALLQEIRAYLPAPRAAPGAEDLLQPDRS